MSTRALLLVSASTLSVVHNRISDAVYKWTTDWQLSELDVRIDCVRAWQISSSKQLSQWQYCVEYGQLKLWCGWSSDLSKGIHRHLFLPDRIHLSSTDHQATLSNEVARDSINSLIESLADTLIGEAQKNELAIPKEMFAYASGAVQVDIRLGDQKITCLLSPEVVMNYSLATQFDIAPVKKVNLMTSIKNVDIALSVKLGQAEVSIGSFVSLAVGDVVRLDSLLDEPVTVLIGDNNAVFNGFLGKSKDSMAIELVRRN